MMHALCPCGHVALGFCSSPDMRATSAARSVYIERAEPISRGPSTLGAHAPMPCIFQDVLLPHDRKHAHGRRPRARMRSLAIGRAPVGEALPPPAWRGVLTPSPALAQATSSHPVAIAPFAAAPLSSTPTADQASAAADAALQASPMLAMHEPAPASHRIARLRAPREFHVSAAAYVALAAAP
eukprot:CAMPEP_0181189506 /NCGR_PEP_ID=MMETSP1096-20121128/11696_1 /TAXON_ID=156174 ORGANISM="Chrysochromulina ericina, Strain CCMP281" /NCGR_SAMPLE_ID=MMETSP1096 /ASSEMBLY_ACC=CAM_ASM_000453 /LENGTH=182 /DNA_ID=CAMNT_0023278659 /DNA_START=196 /DNA_END=740 /DNA_ORIENTATION=+